MKFTDGQKKVLLKLAEKGWLSWNYTSPYETRELNRFCSRGLAEYDPHTQYWRITLAGLAEVQKIKADAKQLKTS
ncbi:MAG: hypothetical protein WC450_11580 [Candidatus Omnitrophota bacterium]|jgi:hypothetical protein